MLTSGGFGSGALGAAVDAATRNLWIVVAGQTGVGLVWLAGP
jgi:hypothetical protein